MPKNVPLSLSIRREIKKHRIHVESGMDKPMDQLGFGNLKVCFRDTKQFLALGQGQSVWFDALIAWTFIVMIRYMLFGLHSLSNKGWRVQPPYSAKTFTTAS
jgi:hypothetical protein